MVISFVMNPIAFELHFYMHVCVHTYMHGIGAHTEAKGPLAAVPSPLLCGSQGWSINFTVTHLYSLSHLASTSFCF